MLLDGGLATELEAAGHDLNDPLWSAKVLLENPEAVAAAHRSFLEAGADCISTVTYQATFPGLTRRDMTVAQAESVFTRAVELAVQVRDEFWAAARGSGRAGPLRPLVAASVGPYGAFLADGSEYRGGYGIGVAELDAFHRDRWHLLAAGPADVIAAETLPCLDEVRVLARLAAETPSKPAWLSFCCREGALLADGEASVAQAGAIAGRVPRRLRNRRQLHGADPRARGGGNSGVRDVQTRARLPELRRRLRCRWEALGLGRGPIRLGAGVQELGAGRRRCRGRVLPRQPLRDPTHGCGAGRRRLGVSGRAPASRRRRRALASLLLGTWRSPVAHLNGVQGVAGSNPAVPIQGRPQLSAISTSPDRSALASAPTKAPFQS